jgi:hypothetical protein
MDMQITNIFIIGHSLLSLVHIDNHQERTAGV